MEVEVSILPPLEGGVIARVVVQRGDVVPELVPLLADGEHGVRQARLLLHEVLHRLGVRVLQPAVGVGDADSVVVVDHGLVAAGGGVVEGWDGEERGCHSCACGYASEREEFWWEGPEEEGERGGSQGEERWHALFLTLLLNFVFWVGIRAIG